MRMLANDRRTPSHKSPIICRDTTQTPSEPLQQLPNLPLLIHLNVIHNHRRTSPFREQTPRTRVLAPVSPPAPVASLPKLADPTPDPREEHPHALQLGLDRPVARDKVLLDAAIPLTATATVIGIRRGPRRRRRSTTGRRSKRLQQRAHAPQPRHARGHLALPRRQALQLRRQLRVPPGLGRRRVRLGGVVPFRGERGDHRGVGFCGLFGVGLVSCFLIVIMKKMQVRGEMGRD
ncbi:hypothetical protein VTK56DRAFT_7832 [Thermocarpiscus australiensis]